jgi:hypothetical protein
MIVVLLWVCIHTGQAEEFAWSQTFIVCLQKIEISS